MTRASSLCRATAGRSCCSTAPTCSRRPGWRSPTTYEDIQKAAQTLNKGKTAGIVAATAPADSFTQQTFEWVALANDCQLVDDAGKVTLNSPECQGAFDFYGNLMKNSSVPGNQDADTTRATYFAGDAAMVIWSSFLLDELAGLRNDALPTCPSARATRRGWPRTAAWSPRWRARRTTSRPRSVRSSPGAS